MNPRKTRRKTTMKIKQALNTYATDGSIFKYLPLYGTATAQQMGITYVLRHSGQKTTSSLVDEYTDINGHLTGDGIIQIASIINAMFKPQWDKMYEALTTEYNPLENYRMVENEESDDVLTYGEREKTFSHGEQSESLLHGTQQNSFEYGGQENTSVHGSQRETFAEGNQSTTFQHGAQTSSTQYGQEVDNHEKTVSGFNSNSYQPAEKTTDTMGQHTDTKSDSSYTDSEAKTNRTDITNRDQYTDTDTVGQHSDSETRQSYTDTNSKQAYTDTETDAFASDSKNNVRELTRSGNIGVTTSQQMLESELNIRSYRFFEHIFSDIDSMLTLSVYYDDYKDDQTYDTSDLDIGLQRLADGVRIMVYKGGVQQDVATVYDGITPDFKLEDGDLYVKP